MSRTFRHEGRSVDFDLWMYPELDFKEDFDLLADMVITSPPSARQLYDWMTAEILPDFSNPFTDILTVEDSPLQFVIGAALVVAGTAILVPGPVDVFLGVAGFAAGGPWGAVAAVALYNLIGLALVGTGLVLMATA